MWHTSIMSDTYNGFEYTFKSRTLNADGELFDRRLLVVAQGVHEAALIARQMIRETLLTDSGPEVLARARAIGVKDNDAVIEDEVPQKCGVASIERARTGRQP
jgi:hypothetical protein